MSTDFDAAFVVFAPVVLPAAFFAVVVVLLAVAFGADFFIASAFARIPVFAFTAIIAPCYSFAFKNACNSSMLCSASLICFSSSPISS